MDIAEFDIEPLRARMAEHPNSPLFARLADLYLADRSSTRNVTEALSLCEKGVALYPAYASGHLVLGKCYQELGRMNEARGAFHRALELSPYNSVAQHLLVLLPDDETIVISEVHALSKAITLGRPRPPQDPSSSVFEPLTQKDINEEASLPTPPKEDDELVQELNSALEADAPLPDYEPFPTYEEYIDLHPASEPVMRLEEYLKGRSPFPARGEAGAAKDIKTDPAPVPQARETIDTAAERADDDAAAVSPAPDAIVGAQEPPRSDVQPSDGFDESSSSLEPGGTDFESLALKLQQAGRIVPVPRAQTPSVVSDLSQERQASLTSIVTPTMAEIYVAQKEYQAAIDAYTELIKKQPAQAQIFRQRIEAIELLKGTS